MLTSRIICGLYGHRYKLRRKHSCYYLREDDVIARFAEIFDLHFTVCPDNPGDGYHLSLSANIPLET
jgi:hypothetical protein